MKKTSLSKVISIFCVALLIFSLGVVFAQSTTNSMKGYTELSFVFISNVCAIDRENYTPVTREYEKKIFNYFRFPQQQIGLQHIFGDYNEFGPATRLVVGMEAAVSDADSSFNISFLKNDVPVEKIPSYLTLEYGIAVDPPTGEDEPKPTGVEPRRNEWINEGGEIDSPPIINVSKDFISKLCDAGQSKYWYSIYFAKYYPVVSIHTRGWTWPRANANGKNPYISDKYCTITDRDGFISAKGINNCANPPIQKGFETEVKKISSIPQTYVASNGFEAHVIPFGGLRTEAFGGVQFFRAIDSSVKCVVSCNGPITEGSKNQELTLHKRILNGKEQFYVDLEEAAEKCSEVKNPEPYVGCYDTGSAYFAYVDKLFFPDTMESVQADWLIRLYKSDSNAMGWLSQVLNAQNYLEWQKAGAGENKPIFQLPLQLASGTPPEVNFDYNVVAITGEEIIVELKPEASDPDGNVKAITWQFGNGETKALDSVQPLLYAFTPGYYTVSLTAYDNDGLKAKKIRTINLSVPNLPNNVPHPPLSVLTEDIEGPPEPLP